jgi:NADH-quinone oxidoreductase subunit M
MAIIAFTGVAMASVYMLRFYIRAMHNRQREGTDASRELSAGDALVIAPLVLLIFAFALYPQGALQDSEPAVKAAIQEVVR